MMALMLWLDGMMMTIFMLPSWWLWLVMAWTLHVACLRANERLIGQPPDRLVAKPLCHVHVTSHQ
jgi:hypothetical protein